MLRSLCLETYGPNHLDWALRQIEAEKEGAQALRVMIQGYLSEDTWLTQEPPSLGSATRVPQDREIGRGLNSKAFNLQLACLFLALVPPIAMPHPHASTSPTPFPCPCSSSGAWTHLPGLLGGSRWGCRQSSCCPQHQHGQGLRPCGVDLLMPV